MTVRHLRLLLGLFLLIAGAGLLVLRFAAPDIAARLNAPTRLTIAGLLGIVLGALNLVRWYASMLDFQRRATPVRKPLQRSPDPVRDEAPNPDFGFRKDDDR